MHRMKNCFYKCADRLVGFVTSRQLRLFAKHLVGKSGLVGAEVGVAKGRHARLLLKKLDIETLYLIDSWSGPFNKYLMSIYRSFSWHKNVKLLPMRATTAISHIPDGSLDFVYIDECHTYPLTREHIELYAQKVKDGGLSLIHI